MRVVLQRVSEASVQVDGQTIAAIGPGLLLLVGFTHGDLPQNSTKLLSKILRLRIFDNCGINVGKADEFMRLPMGPNHEILAVSQFTLLAELDKGTRPSFSKAAPPQEAVALWEDFCTQLESLIPGRAKFGRFGADMKVHLVNDGPVTLLLGD